jgi:hypothetical protein
MTLDRELVDINRSRAADGKPTPTTTCESDTAPFTSRMNGQVTSKTWSFSAPSQIPEDRNYKGGRTKQAAAFISMYGLLLLGILSAICHHLFYSYLNNEAVDEAAVGQTWAIRIGSALAYLFKTVLVAAIAVVYAQGFWFIVRRNLFEIGSLDNFFSLLTNPLLFYNRSLYGKASLLFALAIVSWLLPVSAVLAPGSLTGPLPLHTAS